MPEMNVPDTPVYQQILGPVQVQMKGFDDIDFSAKQNSMKHPEDFDLTWELKFLPDGSKFDASIQFMIKLNFLPDKTLNPENTSKGNFRLFNMVNILKKLGCEVHLDAGGFFTDAKGTRFSSPGFLENINLQLIELESKNTYWAYGYVKPDGKYTRFAPMLCLTKEEIEDYWEKNRSFLLKSSTGSSKDSVELDPGTESDMAF
ncbi:MAG TPA: hypothetical protein PL124_08950 [Candidatus Cloacimonadota bacterium]|nr:hypothetical protein [Candidatus Cloacimonadota bacterium]HPS39524.1 hypothetical protein [Candidatus Cloacimonadota bacterium]